MNKGKRNLNLWSNGTIYSINKGYIFLNTVIKNALFL